MLEKRRKKKLFGHWLNRNTSKQMKDEPSRRKNARDKA